MKRISYGWPWVSYLVTLTDGRVTSYKKVARTQ